MAQADISLQLRLAEDLPRVLGDAVQLQQVVLNLVVNAYQAMADVADGPRVLRIETAEPKPGSIEITVADTGAGVDGPELERMFKPFRLEQARGARHGVVHQPFHRRSARGAHCGDAQSGPRSDLARHAPHDEK
jgi:C4-dicarboxylate-specific signal transduction histidine kinase